MRQSFVLFRMRPAPSSLEPNGSRSPVVLISFYNERWLVLFPMAQELLRTCLDRSKRAAVAKFRAGDEILRLKYEAEMAEYTRVLNAAHAAIKHSWGGKRARLEYLARRRAIREVQGAWKRGVVRRQLQKEIDARVAVRNKDQT